MDYLGLHSYTLTVTFCRNALAVYTKHGLSACISKQVMVGKVPRESREMEPLKYVMMLSTLLSGTVGNL